MRPPSFRETAAESYCAGGSIRASSASAGAQSTRISPVRARCSTERRWNVFSWLATARVKLISGAGSSAAPPPSHAAQSSAARMAAASEGAI